MGEEVVCVTESNDEGLPNDKSSLSELKCDNTWPVENCIKVRNSKRIKISSNDDLCSEVLNPSVSSKENDPCFHTTTSQMDDIEMENGAECDQIFSNCSGNSDSNSSSSDESIKGVGSVSVSVPSVTSEIPEHVPCYGIRKITFKFRGVKDACSGQNPDNGIVNEKTFSRCYNEEPGISSSPCFGSIPGRNPVQSMPFGYPRTVKKLLSTGIFEGAGVKYISPSQKELAAVISGLGFICGCLSCNFSKVVNAYELELHARSETGDPFEHIYLDNGVQLSDILQTLGETHLCDLEDVIKEMAGSYVRENVLASWRASLEQRCMIAADNRFQSTNAQFTNQSPRSISPTLKLGKKQKTGGRTKKRDNDLHRMLFLPNGLQDGVELAYYSKGQKILGGYKQANGILCFHCNLEVSPSQFEAHAGWAARRQPYRNIYTSDGLTLHDIAISLSNGEKMNMGKSDDMCTICGEEGDLILCNGCPRAFHAECIKLRSPPDEIWHCPYCMDIYSQKRTNANGEVLSARGPSVKRSSRVVKAPDPVPAGCAVCGSHDFITGVFHDRTVIICDQCEREYHVACLRETACCDLKELPKGDWFCSEECCWIHSTLQDLALRSAEPVPASVYNKISRKHKEKKLVHLTQMDLSWKIINGRRRSQEHLFYLNKATAIFRECFDPIVSVSGRDLIPLMVYGRNISGQEFGGMYCIVLTVRSVVVSAGLLRIFGGAAAELPLVATGREHQGKGYMQVLMACIEKLLYSLSVARVVLPASEGAELIWTTKFGFTRMTNERWLELSKELKPTVFNRTLMLEKDVQWTSPN